MDDRIRFIGLKALALLLTASLSLAGAGASAKADPAETATAGQFNIAEAVELSGQVWSMAAEGRFDDAIADFRDQLQHASHEELAALHRDLMEHEHNEQVRRERTLELYEERIEALHEHLDAGDLEKALSAAVEAHSLAVDPDALLESDKIQRLVAEAEANAAEYADAGDWLRAMGLYRGLELLFEDENRYSERLQRVARHVSLLRLYAPRTLQELYEEEADREDDLEAELDLEMWEAEPDEWKRRLRGISTSMLNESLHFGARRYVEGSSFEQLLLGAIDGLKVMFETPGLEQTFPNLADPEKAEPFLDYLDQTRLSVAQREVPMSYVDASQIINRLIERNASTVDLPESVLVHELGDGALRSLDDFSSVVWPHQKERFERTTRGEFSGVGIQITSVNRELTVVTPLEDTPAHRAGIRPGDKIVSIDGKSTLGMELDQAVDRITGREGTVVVLGVQGPSDDQPRQLELERSSIQIVSVKGWQRRGTDWDFFIDRDHRIGYARVSTFGPQTADELDAAIEGMKADAGINGLVLDLRFNPGGRLDAAIDLSNRFLDGGTIVSTSQQTAAGGSWNASPAHTVGDFPIVVLINKGSASASEILAGALQAHDRALVVGENTFGKGSVQNLFHIGGNQAYLKLTTQYYRLPDGRIIHRRPGAEKWGIHPDVHVRMTEQQTAEALEARMLLDVLREEGEAFDPHTIMSPRDRDRETPIETAEDILKHGLDPQLETALILLRTRLIADRGVGALRAEKANATP